MATANRTTMDMHTPHTGLTLFNGRAGEVKNWGKKCFFFFLDKNPNPPCERSDDLGVGDVDLID